MLIILSDVEEDIFEVEFKIIKVTKYCIAGFLYEFVINMMDVNIYVDKLYEFKICFI